MIRLWSKCMIQYRKNKVYEPRFFKDVFLHLQQKGKEDESYKGCALVFDAMHIKFARIYNKETGSYEGYANFGPDILAFKMDDVAT